MTRKVPTPLNFQWGWEAVHSLEVGVCVDQYVACWFFSLWAKSVDCSEGIRAPGVRCCVSDEKIHLWKKTQQNVTLVLLKCCLGCAAGSIILREVVKEHCYEFPVPKE